MPTPTTDHHNAKTQELQAKNAWLLSLIGELPSATYSADVPLDYLEGHLSRLERDWGLNLLPDFQRGHVWTPEQGIAYIEAILQRKATPIVQFNAPTWNDGKYQGDLSEEMQIIDGLQRLTAVRSFMKGEFRIFDNQVGVEDLVGSRYDLKRPQFSLKTQVFDFQTKAELLAYYLSINAGGTPHSEAEIARVREMLEKAAKDESDPRSLRRACSLPRGTI